MQKREAPNIGRRAFFRKLGVGALVGTGLTEAAYHREVFAPKLDALPSVPIDPRKKVAVVYYPFFEDPVEDLKDVGEHAGSLALGATAGAAVAPQIKKGAPLLTRRKLLGVAAGAALGTAALAVGRDGKTASEERITGFLGLMRDLKAAGYSVLHSGTLIEFHNALQRARHDRTPDARTVVLISAHGVHTTPKELDRPVSLILDSQDHRVGLSVEQLADLLKEVPGRTLVAANTCHFDVEPLRPLFDSKKVSIISANDGRSDRVSSAYLPLFTALRVAIRQKGDALSQARSAYSSLVKRLPLLPRLYTRHVRSKLATFGGPFEI